MALEDIQWDVVPDQFWGAPKETADFICLAAIKGVNAGLTQLSEARHMAWSKFLIAMNLKPQMNAKEFYKVFDSMWKANEKLKKKPLPKPVRSPAMPPILVAPPELAADVLGTGGMGLTPTPAAKPKKQPKRTKTLAQPAGTIKYRLDQEGLTPTGADMRAKRLHEQTTYKFIKIVKTANGYAVYKAGVGEARRTWTGEPERYVDYPDKSMANWGVIHLRDMGCAAHMKLEGGRWVVYKGACNLSAKFGRVQSKPPVHKPAAQTARKPAKPKTKKTAAAPKLTASQREYLAINGFVRVKRGGKYVTITN